MKSSTNSERGGPLALPPPSPLRQPAAIPPAAKAAAKRKPARLKNRADALTRIHELQAQLSDYLDPAAVADVYAAYQFGAKAHHGQTRQSGEDYISHPLAVAQILGSMRLDSRTMIAAILHDVVEDTDISLAQLAAEFGEDVAGLVDGVSKISQLESHSKLNSETASLQKMFMAMAKDIRVIIIKLADRLHNMRTLKALPADKQRRIAKQTMEIYAPIAHRLGIQPLYRELESLGFAVLYPNRCRTIAKHIALKKRGRKPIVRELCRSLREHLQQHGVSVEVEGREKPLHSIYRKMQQKHLSVREMPDVNAVRVVTEDRMQCYQALGLIHQLYKPRAESFKDYIAIPKINGYQSLHTVVMTATGQLVEVQIRSHDMHRVAENGVAAHWLYKTDTNAEHAPLQLAQQWLNSFLDSQQKSADSGEYLEHLKAALYPDEVYVFTPKGNIKQLPRGATALDFAYAVHSDVGDRCLAARINHVPVPLHEKLNSGDTVHITTRRAARPQPDWLNYAVTSKARASIRYYLNQQKEKEALKLGKKLLKQALRDQGYKRLLLPSEEKVNLLQQLELQDWSRLLVDIGFGRRLPILVAKQFMASNQVMASTQASNPDATLKPATSADASSIIIEGTECLLLTYANCCLPIPGDKIIGTTTRGHGVVVHRLSCHNCKGIMKHPDNYFHLNWSASIRGLFRVRVKLETNNKPGVLARVAQTIASHDSNINHLHVDAEYGDTSRMSFVVEVRDRTHLANIMRQLHIEPCVIKLARA